MDTYVKIIIYAETSAAEEALDAAFTRMEEVVNIATTFNENGEAYQLNQEGTLQEPSAELLELINLSLNYSDLTDGYFDITCQPLLDLWGYNPNAEKQFWELDKASQQVKISETAKIVGSDKIIAEDSQIYFQEEGMKITLGGVAKGYAVDEALAVLEERGIRHALIDAGGDIRTMGTQPDNELWSIVLVNPDNTSEFLADFSIKDKAVTTSGNYERYFDPEKKAGHILNPKTGYSASDCISVTIITETCTYADALATGVFVMGPELGLNLVEALDNVECLIIDNERVIHQSSGLSGYLNER